MADMEQGQSALSVCSADLLAVLDKTGGLQGGKASDGLV